MQESVTGNIADINLLKRIISYTKPYKRIFLFSFFITIFLGFLSPIRPYLIQYTVDNFIIIPNLKGLILFSVLMVFFLIFESIVQFLQTYVTNYLGQSVIKDIRTEIFNKIVNFKLKYFDKTPVGILVTRTISDIETIAEIFSEGLLNIIGELLRLVVVLAVMFYTSWQLTLICLIPIPFLIVATYIFKNSIKKAFQEVRKQVSRLNAFVQEHLVGMKIVQIFNREKQEFEKFKKINKEHLNAHIKAIWAYSIFFPIVEILSALSISFLVWWGAKGVINEYISFGSLVAFILYIHMLYRPIRLLADRFNVLQMGMVSAERVFRILDTSEKIDTKGKLKVRDISGTIEFKNVYFAYNNENWVLKNISFKVDTNETVALVGETGAGKSSIINLITRLYDFQKGEISIDGINIKDYDLYSLRRKISVVLQDVFLFSDTIYNNIVLRNNEIKYNDVVEAAKKVGAHNFIMKLPGNYNFNVKERGVMLSTGQRQLIAFIRAYVHKPKILILDEATSSVDSETEQLIQKAIETITKERTSIIIAHRLSTIVNADKIIVINNGEIVEQGKHKELIQKNSYYKKLYNMQYVSEFA